VAAVVQVEGRSTVGDRQPRSFCRRTCRESAGRLACGSRWNSIEECFYYAYNRQQPTVMQGHAKYAGTTPAND